MCHQSVVLKLNCGIGNHKYSLCGGGPWVSPNAKGQSTTTSLVTSTQSTTPHVARGTPSTTCGQHRPTPSITVMLGVALGHPPPIRLLETDISFREIAKMKFQIWNSNKFA